MDIGDIPTALWEPARVPGRCLWEGNGQSGATRARPPVAGGDDEHRARRLADELFKAMPDSAERLYGYVSREELERFKERAVATLARVLGDYLL